MAETEGIRQAGAGRAPFACLPVLGGGCFRRPMGWSDRGEVVPASSRSGSRCGHSAKQMAPAGVGAV